jgi:5'-nucleotidase
MIPNRKPNLGFHTAWKAPILKAFGAHIFFDDQEKHVLGASAVVPSGHVPGPHDA